MNNCMAVVEQRNGALRRVSFEVVTAARRAADASQGEVHALLIGGGLVEDGDLLLPPVREAFRGLMLAAGHRPPVRIEAAALGPGAGAAGAALLAGDLVR